ncbi:MAG: tyrosine-protein phosphatase [Desulfitobacteriaceae bacterium]|nr:tyrosine-protein phosphatase [Bacillota bacterium]MDI6915535.1 tyrosine-protein phosphatase [Desulfitobacteriaceae bacterium]
MTTARQLIEPENGLFISRVELPKEFYWVLGPPAPLAGMKYPRGDFPWYNLKAAGFAAVVSLHPGSYDPAPLSLVFSEHLEDLVHGGPPSNADRERGAVERAVKATLSLLNMKKGVVIHCQGGRGRTGTVLGCVLRELGYGAGEIIDYLERLHRKRGKLGWPESDWQADLVRCWANTF